VFREWGVSLGFPNYQVADSSGIFLRSTKHSKLLGSPTAIKTPHSVPVARLHAGPEISIYIKNKSVNFLAILVVFWFSGFPWKNIKGESLDWLLSRCSRLSHLVASKKNKTEMQSFHGINGKKLKKLENDPTCIAAGPSPSRHTGLIAVAVAFPMAEQVVPRPA
jgi:hypothetical protein